METRKTYGELLTKANPSTEDMQKIIEFESFIQNSKKYPEYTSDENHEIVSSYEQEIAFLQSLKGEERNPNIDRSIQVGQEIGQITSLDERKRQEKELKEQQERQLELKLQKRAGYMNASILIFVICNLGIFLAALLLMLQ